MTDPTATDQARFIYDLMARYLQDPTIDVVTPIKEFVNSTDDPPLALVVLTASSIIAAARTFLEIADNNPDEAQARVAYALLVNDINEVFAPTEEGTQ